MKFVWCGGGGGGLQRPAWWQLFLDNWRQRRVERREKARWDAAGVEHSSGWWL